MKDFIKGLLVFLICGAAGWGWGVLCWCLIPNLIISFIVCGVGGYGIGWGIACLLDKINFFE